ncbi:uncharacterized protein LOC143178965 [Calliopsis andreniformis]|uniref:uncharacterized protein LOC143178965 n=1 Tax=Calliopsis andreniformis TaxID=337506 RepID=UPI003FCD97C7
MKNFEAFPDHRFIFDKSQDPLLGNMLFSLRSEEWKEERALVSTTFTSSKLKTMFPLILDRAQDYARYVSKLPENERDVELKDLLTKYTNDVIASCAFGVTVDTKKDPKNAIYVHGRSATNFATFRVSITMLLYRTAPKLARFLGLKFVTKKDSDFFYNVISSTVKAREKQNISRPDMIQLLMDIRNKKQHGKILSIDKITSHSYTFFFGGFDTVASQLSFVLYHLAVNSEVHDKLQKEIDDVLEDTQGSVTYESIMGMQYLDAVINESMRISPVAPFLDRVAVKKFELPPALPGAKPLVVEPDTTLWLPVYSIQHDPNHFPDPEKFDPERFLGDGKKLVNSSTLIAFGIGPRICIGNRFALMNMKVIIFQLLSRCNFKRCSKTTVPLKIANRVMTFAPQNGFWVKIEPRKHVSPFLETCTTNGQLNVGSASEEILSFRYSVFCMYTLVISVNVAKWKQMFFQLDILNQYLFKNTIIYVVLQEILEFLLHICIVNMKPFSIHYWIINHQKCNLTVFHLSTRSVDNTFIVIFCCNCSAIKLLYAIMWSYTRNNLRSHIHTVEHRHVSVMLSTLNKELNLTNTHFLFCLDDKFIVILSFVVTTKIDYVVSKYKFLNNKLAHSLSVFHPFALLHVLEKFAKTHFKLFVHFHDFLIFDKLFKKYIGNLLQSLFYKVLGISYMCMLQLKFHEHVLTIETFLCSYLLYNMTRARLSRRSHYQMRHINHNKLFATKLLHICTQIFLFKSIEDNQPTSPTRTGLTIGDPQCCPCKGRLHIQRNFMYRLSSYPTDRKRRIVHYVIGLYIDKIEEVPNFVEALLKIIHTRRSEQHSPTGVNNSKHHVWCFCKYLRYSLRGNSFVPVFYILKSRRYSTNSIKYLFKNTIMYMVLQEILEFLLHICIVNMKSFKSSKVQRNCFLPLINTLLINVYGNINNSNKIYACNNVQNLRNKLRSHIDTVAVNVLNKRIIEYRHVSVMLTALNKELNLTNTHFLFCLDEEFTVTLSFVITTYIDYRIHFLCSFSICHNKLFAPKLLHICTQIFLFKSIEDNQRHIRFEVNKSLSASVTHNFLGVKADYRFNEISCTPRFITKLRGLNVEVQGQHSPTVFSESDHGIAMESLTYILSVLAAIVAIYYYLLKPRNIFKEHGVPYIPPWPILGNFEWFFFGKQGFYEQQQEVYNLQPNAKYVGYYEFLRPVIVLRDIDLIKSVTMKNVETFPNRRIDFAKKLDPLLSSTLFSLRSEEWKDERAVVSAAFTSSKIKSMFPLLDNCAQEYARYVSKLPENERDIELKDFLAKYTNDVIASCAFGLIVDSKKDPKNAIYTHGCNATNFASLRMTTIMLLYRMAPKLARFLGLKFVAKKDSDFFYNVISSTVKTREEQNISRPDMIQLLMETRNRKQPGKILSIDDITYHCFSFFFAGFDIVSSQLSFVLYDLAVYSEVHDKLQKEIDEVLEDTQGNVTYDSIMGMKYLDAVINESMRISPVGNSLDRLAVKKFELPPTLPGAKPWIVKPGTSVWLPVYSIHHDPNHFPDPEKFDPGRFLRDGKKILNSGTFMPFGIGARMCIGKTLALLEMKVLIFHLLARCDFKCCSRSTVPLKLAIGVMALAAQNGFWVKIEPRKHVSPFLDACMTNGTLNVGSE